MNYGVNKNMNALAAQKCEEISILNFSVKTQTEHDHWFQITKFKHIFSNYKNYMI
jgi:hypothetical protein